MRERPGTTARTWRWPLGVLALVLAAPLAYLLFAAAGAEWLARQAFDPQAWRSARGAGDPVRIRMVDDLLKSHDFRGKTKSEVEALLGPPDSTEYFSDCDLVYWLGPERGFMSIDSEWLALRLDARGRVSDCQVVRD
jgi:hypothetical protein